MKKTVLILGVIVMFMGLYSCTPQSLKNPTPAACCGDDDPLPPPPPPPPEFGSHG